jgi:hypothetical protein
MVEIAFFIAINAFATESTKTTKETLMHLILRHRSLTRVLLPIPLALLLSTLLLLLNQTGASSAAGMTAASPRTAPAGAAVERCFTEANDPFVDISEGSVAWADYDGDGDLDLLIAGNGGSDEPVTRFYRNGGGSFTEIDAGLINLLSTSAAWADFDGDGDPDLLLTGLDSDFDRQSKFYRNDNGDFVDVETPFVKVSNGAAAWADYDGDGDPDVVITGSTDGGSRASTLYRNDNGMFVDSGIELIGVDSSSVVWADYDGDGDPDLLLMGQYNYGLGEGYTSASTTRLYRNDNGALVDSEIDLVDLEEGSAAWADYDGDGDLDLILMGVSYNSFSPTTNQLTYFTDTVLYRNDNGTLTQASSDLTDLGEGDVSWADYDGDGDLDFFIMGTRGGIKDAASLDPFAQASILYQNNGGSASDFSPFFDPVIALRGGSAAWADYDHDGDPDLLVTGAIGASSTPWTLLYRNGPCAGDNVFDVADGDVQGLIDAINAANAACTSDPARSVAAPAVINLAANGHYTLTAVDNTDAGSNGLPVITGTVIINGNGATIARSSAAGTPEFRILRARSGSTLTLRDLTLTNGAVTTGDKDAQFGGALNSFGTVTLERTRIISNTAGFGGGGLLLGRGPVVITDSLVISNSAGGGGGGIQVQAGTVELIAVTIENNRAPDGGGLVTVVGSEALTLTVNRSTIVKNSATGSDNPVEGTGGGIRLSQAISGTTMDTIVVVNDTLIANNQAINGGGIGMGLIQPGSLHLIQLTLNRSAVVNNVAQGQATQQGNGGGILNINAILHMVNSTISGNTAIGNPQVQFSGVGGGIANARTGLPTTISMTNTSVISNTALAGGGILNALAAGATGPVVSFANSLIAGNTALGGAAFGPSCLNQGGALTSNGHNLDQNDACGFTAVGDQTNVAPLIGLLADNGGPTPTHALLDNSPAIDAGNNANCPATDQRGVARPVGDSCDIGAYEGGTRTVEFTVFLPMTVK